MPYKNKADSAKNKRKYYLAHKKEIIEKERKRYRANLSKIQDYQMRYRYGIGMEEYKSILSAQGNKCAICGSTKANRKSDRMHIDHNHSTGKIRGLICSNCNTALGLVKDSIETLGRMIEYLELTNN